jgi:hypothetical protein
MNGFSVYQKAPRIGTRNCYSRLTNATQHPRALSFIPLNATKTGAVMTHKERSCRHDRHHASTKTGPTNLLDTVIDTFRLPFKVVPQTGPAVTITLDSAFQSSLHMKVRYHSFFGDRLIISKAETLRGQPMPFSFSIYAIFIQGKLTMVVPRRLLVAVDHIRYACCSVCRMRTLRRTRTYLMWTLFAMLVVQFGCRPCSLCLLFSLSNESLTVTNVMNSQAT